MRLWLAADSSWANIKLLVHDMKKQTLPNRIEAD
jgi:hypothetical protein